MVYAAVTILCTRFYQLFQNLTHNSSSRVSSLMSIRFGLLGLAMTFGKTPISWGLYDATNFVIFMGNKVLLDTILMRVVKGRLSEKESSTVRAGQQMGPATI